MIIQAAALWTPSPLPASNLTAFPRTACRAAAEQSRCRLDRPSDWKRTGERHRGNLLWGVATRDGCGAAVTPSSRPLTSWLGGSEFRAKSGSSSRISCSGGDLAEAQHTPGVSDGESLPSDQENEFAVFFTQRLKSHFQLEIDQRTCHRVLHHCSAELVGERSPSLASPSSALQHFPCDPKRIAASSLSVRRNGLLFPP